MKEKRRRVVRAVLGALVLFDLTLVVWVAFAPHLWFWAFHVDADADALSLLLLRRCGANWAAFFLFQAIAFVRWEREPVWLAVVAGVRLSDIFTDPTYAALSEAPTWFSLATLPAMGLINLGLGLFLLRAYQQHRPGVSPGSGAMVGLVAEGEKLE